MTTRKVGARSRATRVRGSKPGLGWLSLAILLSVWFLSCSESGTEPAGPRTASLPLRVVFAPADSNGLGPDEPPVDSSTLERSGAAAAAAGTRRGDGAAPALQDGAAPALQDGATPALQAALISEIIARAYDVGDGGALRAEAQTELTPSDTRFELSLSVPPADYYRVEVRALGTRQTGDVSTEFGLLYSGTGFAMNVAAGSADTVEIVMEERVPRLLLEILGASYRLSWTPIAGAVEYRLRETSDTGTIEWSVAGEDTTLTPPPVFVGGGVLTYRVAAVAQTSEISAFSEPVGIQVPGPIAPGAVTDLRSGRITSASVELLWTAPGDDGDSGTATAYEIRRHAEPITEDNFGAATLITGAPAPSPGGSPESFVVLGLDPETQYYFALRAIDDVPLTSPLSNVLTARTAPAIEPPICIIDPPALDFGDVVIGSSLDLSFTVQNLGGGILVGDIAELCPQFSIVSGAGPFGLSSNDLPLTVVVRYEPLLAGPASCQISTSAECQEVPCTGNGLTGAWWSGFGSPPGQGVDGDVRALHVFNGVLAVGGTFRQVGPNSAANVARWSGTSWGFYGNGLPGAVLAFGEAFGELIAGGAFFGGAGDLLEIRMARYIDPDGWEGFFEYPDAPVYAMYTFPDSIVVGGGFKYTNFEGLLNYVGVFYDGVFFPIYTPGTPPGTDGPVFAITQYGSSLFVGGSFTSAGAVAAPNIARWDGSAWQSVGGIDGPVYALRVIGGSLYAAGDFTTAGSVSAPGIARWNRFGWTAVDASLDLRPVLALGELNGSLIAGGSFVVDTPNGTLNRIARWTGTTWLPLDSGMGDGAVAVLEEFQGSLYAGGSFTTAGGIPSLHIARWDPPVGLP